MLKAREILRGKTTVSEVLKRAEKAGITWPIELSDKQLISLLYPPQKSKKSPFL